MRSILLASLGLLIATFGAVADDKDSSRRYKLVVEKSGWGEAGHADLTAVLRSACDELAAQFPNLKLAPIRVKNAEWGPQVLFERTLRGEIVVGLDSKHRFWCQHAYQMSHEFCHILCGYKEGDKSNLWFEESLCEMASVYSLRSMANTWKTKAPYPNWRSYSKAITDYADDLVKKHALPADTTLPEFYRKHREHLSENATDRPLNGKVAMQLLPLFEKQPQHWRAVSWLNHGRTEEKKSFQEYLADWHRHCPAEHKPFVAEIAAKFDVVLP